MKKIYFAALGALLFSGCALDVPGGSDEQDNGTDRTTQPAAVSAELSNRALGGPGTANPHCVGSVSSNAVSCYSTFREAIAFATGGAITDAPDARAALADDGFARRINALAIRPNVDVLIGIDYVDINFQGNTFTWTSFIGCDGDPNTMDFSTASLSPFRWNDVISSFHSFSSCQTVLFENDNFGGATTQKAVDLAGLGAAMNDRASSIQWF